MDFRETDEQRMLRQMVRKFAQNEVRPVCRELEQRPNPKDCYPWEVLKKASKLGLRTLSIPAEYGGGGVTDVASYIIFCEELSVGDFAFGISLGTQTVGLAAYLDRVCSKEQKDEWFPKIVADDTFLIAVAQTEPNAGTDNVLMASVPGAGMQTYAKRRGEEYIINGTKHFITNGGLAKLYILNARTDKKLSLSECKSQFLVSPTTIGFSIGSFHNKSGGRCGPTAELIFEDMHVPASQLLGKEGGSPRDMLQAAVHQIAGLACRIGLLRAMYEASVEYASTRIQGGKPIIQHQLIAAHLSEMRVRIEAARQLVYRQGWCWENNYEYDPKITTLLRSFICQCGAHIAFQANDIHGGMGCDKEMVIDKLVRDMFATLHAPSIGQALITGAPGWVPQTTL